jgi:hypothetical protein
MITSSQLYTELTTDPAGLGYAAHLAIRDDTAPADLLNAITGPGAGSVTLAYLTKDRAILGLLPSILALGSASAPIQAKYSMVVDLIKSSNFLNINATTLALFASAVADGVATQPQVDAMITRMGSRAEVLWGIDTVVTHEMVSAALNANGA